ncbi:MAG: TOBE domain-containing protein [Anaerolineae bacterium]|nr:TOBE domain-containing protein [Anaerolineae bacterium]
MKISARNVLAGTVVSVNHGAVNTEVTIALPGGAEIVSVITKSSAESLDLAAGKQVYAVIKASNVMIATD